MKTKRKRKGGKKKRTLEGDPSHRKTEGKIFQTKSDPDGGEGSGERRKGRTAGGGVLPELKKLENRPFKKKKKKGHDPSGVPGGVARSPPPRQGGKPPPVAAPRAAAATGCSSSRPVRPLLPFI